MELGRWRLQSTVPCTVHCVQLCTAIAYRGVQLYRSYTLGLAPRLPTVHLQLYSVQRSAYSYRYTAARCTVRGSESRFKYSCKCDHDRTIGTMLRLLLKLLRSTSSATIALYQIATYKGIPIRNTLSHVWQEKLHVLLAIQRSKSILNLCLCVVYIYRSCGLGECRRLPALFQQRVHRLGR